MTSIEHTAYPRLKRTLTPKELDQIYTPTPAELFLAHRSTKGPVATLAFSSISRFSSVWDTPWRPARFRPRSSSTLLHALRFRAPDLFTGVPPGKIKQFAAEAKTLDAARMRDMLSRKRYTLAAALLYVQSAQALDDLAEMLIKRMLAIHQIGKEALL